MRIVYAVMLNYECEGSDVHKLYESKEDAETERDIVKVRTTADSVDIAEIPLIPPSKK